MEGGELGRAGCSRSLLLTIEACYLEAPARQFALNWGSLSRAQVEGIDQSVHFSSLSLVFSFRRADLSPSEFIESTRLLIGASSWQFQWKPADGLSAAHRASGRSQSWPYKGERIRIGIGIRIGVEFELELGFELKCDGDSQMSRESP